MITLTRFLEGYLIPHEIQEVIIEDDTLIDVTYDFVVPDNGIIKHTDHGWLEMAYHWQGTNEYLARIIDRANHNPK